MRILSLDSSTFKSFIFYIWKSFRLIFYKFKRGRWFSNRVEVAFVIGYPSNLTTMLHYQRISPRLSDWKEWSVIGFMRFIWWRRSSDINQIWRLCYTTESFGPSMIRQVLRRFVRFHSGVSHRISDKDEGELVDCMTNRKCHLNLDLRPKGVKNMTRAFHCRNWCEIPSTF